MIQDIVQRAFRSWWRVGPASAGAALSYYALFSLPPVVIIVIALGSVFISPDVIEGSIMHELHRLIGQQATLVVGAAVEATQTASAGIVAGILGLVTISIGAIGFFGEFQTVLNKLWHVPLRPHRSVWKFVQHKLIAFSMVFVLGILIVFSLALSTILSVFEAWVPVVIPHSLIAFLFISALFMIIYALLPSKHISLRAVFVGGLVTALLFMFGKFAIEVYIRHSVIASAYGAANAVIIMLLAVYYSVQVVLFGAALTYAIDQRYDVHS